MLLLFTLHLNSKSLCNLFHNVSVCSFSRRSTTKNTSDKHCVSTKEDKSRVSRTTHLRKKSVSCKTFFFPGLKKYLRLFFKLESLQKQVYQLEEQLHNEMQLKDELEQKCRSELSHLFLCNMHLFTLSNLNHTFL